MSEGEDAVIRILPISVRRLTWSWNADPMGFVLHDDFLDM